MIMWLTCSINPEVMVLITGVMDRILFTKKMALSFSLSGGRSRTT